MFLAMHEMRQGNLDEAKPYVDTLFDAFFGVPEVRQMVARWHFLDGLRQRDAGQTGNALAALRRSFNIASDLPGVAELYGNLLLEHGELAEARAPLTEFYRQQPENPRSAMLLARLYAGERRFRQARELLTHAEAAARQQGDERLAAFCREILGQLPKR